MRPPSHGAGRWSGRKRAVHRQRRERRLVPELLLHIDWHDLIVVLHDVTVDIYYAQLVAQESRRTVPTALPAVAEQEGVFCAFYSDGTAISRSPRRREGASIGGG